MLDEIIETARKPVVVTIFIILFVVLFMSSIFKVKLDIEMNEYQAKKEIHRQQIVYCEYFFQRQVGFVAKQFPDLPRYQIKYCILKCQYETVNRLYNFNIQGTNAYIENLTASFLNLIWVDAYDPRIHSDAFKDYIREACGELVGVLVSIQNRVESELPEKYINNTLLEKVF